MWDYIPYLYIISQAMKLAYMETDMTDPKTVAEYFKLKDTDWDLEHLTFVNGNKDHIRSISLTRDKNDKPVYLIELAHSRKLTTAYPTDPITFRHWKAA